MRGELVEIYDQTKIKVKEIYDEDKSNDLEESDEKDIDYDYLVLWTGSNYCINEKEVETVYNIHTKQQRKEFYK